MTANGQDVSDLLNVTLGANSALNDALFNARTALDTGKVIGGHHADEWLTLAADHLRRLASHVDTVGTRAWEQRMLAGLNAKAVQA